MSSTRIWMPQFRKWMFYLFLSMAFQNTAHAVPMKFDLIGDGIDLGNLRFAYDFSNSQSLKVDQLVIDRNNFIIGAFETDALDSRLSKILPQDQASKLVWLTAWPDALFESAQLEAISRSGNLLWSVNIDKDAKEKWAADLKRWKQLMLDQGFKEAQLKEIPLFKTQFGIKSFSLADQGIKEPVRFCLLSKNEFGQTRFCTSFYEPVKAKHGTRLSAIPRASSPPRVFLMGDVAPLKQDLNLGYGVAVPFFVEFPNGDTFEFYGVTQKPSIVDGYVNKGGLIDLTFEDMRPLSKAKQINKEVEGYFTKTFEWQQTIKEVSEYWSTQLAKGQTEILIPGKGGGIFIQELKITKVPSYKSRLDLEAKTIQSTYSGSPTIYGAKAPELKLSTKQISVKPTKTNFSWKFKAQDRGDYNRSYLQVNDGQNTFRSYYEIYKGYPREFSLRLTGLLGSNRQLLLLGEGAFNYWFENILGWDQYYLSTQRWGASVKAFRSITPLKISEYSASLQAITFDLKYRLTPGLWGRDESWGLILGYLNTSYDAFNATLVGGGLFWARSMPKVFDDFMNYFPFMNYPKWVDLEFIYYNASTNPKVLVNSPPRGAGTYALNFHGKVMWTKKFFGEAGFGIKQFDYNQEFEDRTKLNYRFTALYGTVGIGANF